MGNFVFGALANAYGIDKSFTLQQAGAAQLRKSEDQGGKGQGFIESQWNSFTYEHYGDDEDDQYFIGAGYDWFSME